MIKIGITGSIASRKSLVAHFLSKRKKFLFSADEEVKTLYKQKDFKFKLAKKFKLNEKSCKEEVKNKILNKKINLKKLGKFIQPFVRKRMHKFTKRNHKAEILFYEIPLLVESNLMPFFDLIILIVSDKKLRVKRYKDKNGDIRLFNIIEKNQIPQNKKIKYSDFVIVNNKSKKILKNKINDIII